MRLGQTLTALGAVAFLVAAVVIVCGWPRPDSRIMARLREVSVRRAPGVDPDRRAASTCWVGLAFGAASPLLLYNALPVLDVLSYPVQVAFGATLTAVFLACDVLAFWVRFVDGAPQALRPRALRDRAAPDR